jgi:hypothetical protein
MLNVAAPVWQQQAMLTFKDVKTFLKLFKDISVLLSSGGKNLNYLKIVLFSMLQYL